jgi:hypothetical protein
MHTSQRSRFFARSGLGVWCICTLLSSPGTLAQDFAEDGRRFTPNFHNAALHEVVAIVSRATERTIENPWRFREITLTYTTQQSLTRSELWQAFVQMLDSKGLMIVASEDAWRIVERPKDLDDPGAPLNTNDDSGPASDLGIRR